MRSKIIAVNALMVVIVGLCAFGLFRISNDAQRAGVERARDEAARASKSAAAKLELDAVRAERWLERSLDVGAARAVFRAGLAQARGEAATEQANRLRAMARQSFDLVVSFVAFVDARGIVLGRDGTNLMRGENWRDAHPGIRRALETGRSGSELWTSIGSGEFVLTSQVPVHDENGELLGLVVLATPLNDERLAALSEWVGGHSLVLAMAEHETIQVRAKSASSASLAPWLEQQGKDHVSRLGSARLAILPQGPGGQVLALAPLGLEGEGSSAVLAAVVEPTGAASVPFGPIAGAVGLGLVLVAIGGWLLGGYIATPIEKLEDGLLAILNGNREHRFDIEHAELGGVIFRLNQLLNQIFGEEEQEQPRAPSVPDSMTF